MHIVLAHDSFTQSGGAERVIDALHELFPQSPVYTVVRDKKYRGDLTGWDILVTPLQYLYRVFPRFQFLFPLVPLAVWLTKVSSDTQVLLSSSSSFAKGFGKPKGAVHISYCHTPSRFLWTDIKNTLQETPWILRPMARAAIYFLRRWDLKAAENVDYCLANSKEVRRRIQEFYHRDSVIIYPGIDTIFWRPTRPKAGYFLMAGRLQAHKEGAGVIELFSKLGLPLRVVGIGRSEPYLRSIAKPNIKFLGRVSDEALRDEYSGAQGLLYPQFEDFGLMPLEAAACGTATVGLNRGGTLETVEPEMTGELFDGSVKDLAKIIGAWDYQKYNQEVLRQHAAQFSKEVFKRKILEFVEQVMSDMKRNL